jgi:hypothetical protein
MVGRQTTTEKEKVMSTGVLSHLVPPKPGTGGDNLSDSPKKKAKRVKLGKKVKSVLKKVMADAFYRGDATICKDGILSYSLQERDFNQHLFQGGFQVGDNVQVFVKKLSLRKIKLTKQA